MQTRGEDLRTDETVGDAVSSIRHREMDARPVLFVRSEERQSILGFRECAGPCECGFDRKSLYDMLYAIAQSGCLACDRCIAPDRDVDAVILAADDQPPSRVLRT